MATPALSNGANAEDPKIEQWMLMALNTPMEAVPKPLGTLNMPVGWNNAGATSSYGPVTTLSTMHHQQPHTWSSANAMTPCAVSYTHLTLPTNREV